MKFLEFTQSSVLRYIAGLPIIAAALLFLYPNLAENLFASGAGMKMFMSHGYCYFWVPPLVILHVGSDSIIGLSYVAISVTLAYLVHRSLRDISFNWIISRLRTFYRRLRRNAFYGGHHRLARELHAFRLC